MSEVRYDLPITEPWSVVIDPFTGIEHRHPVSVSKCKCHIDDGMGMCANCAHFYARLFVRQDQDGRAPVVELNRKYPPVTTWGLAWSWRPVVAVRYVD